MKTAVAALFAISGLVANVAAAPLQKRAISTVIHIETVYQTSTYWVQPGGAPAPTTANFNANENVVLSSPTPTLSSSANSEPKGHQDEIQNLAPFTTASAEPTSSVALASSAPEPTSSSTSTSTTASAAQQAEVTSSTSTFTAAAAPTSAPPVVPKVDTPAVVAAVPSPAPAPAPVASTGNSGKGRVYSGDITYFTPGSGSCGQVHGDNDHIVAISHLVMGKHANPNNAPNCGRQITISYGGVEHTATVVDTCPECSEGSIDLSPALFKAVAPAGDGRVHDVNWWFSS